MSTIVNLILFSCYVMFHFTVFVCVWIQLLLKFQWNLCRHGLAIHTQFIKNNCILSYNIRLLYHHFINIFVILHLFMLHAHEMHIEAFWSIDGVLTSSTCTSISLKLLFRLSNADAFFSILFLWVWEYM